MELGQNDSFIFRKGANLYPNLNLGYESSISIQNLFQEIESDIISIITSDGIVHKGSSIDWIEINSLIS